MVSLISILEFVFCDIGVCVTPLYKEYSMSKTFHLSPHCQHYDCSKHWHLRVSWRRTTWLRAVVVVETGVSAILTAMNTHHVRCTSAAGACQLGFWRTMNYGAHLHTHIDSRATNGGSHGTHWDYIPGKWQSNWQHFFSDSVPRPQTQLHFGRKSGLTEVKCKHSSLLAAHISSESGITMPILPIVLFSWTPGATWRAWFFFFKLYLSKDTHCQNKDKLLYLCHHVRSTRTSKKRSEDKDRMCLELAEVGITTIWLFVWSSVCYFWPGCFQRSHFCLITSFWYFKLNLIVEV